MDPSLARGPVALLIGLRRLGEAECRGPGHQGGNQCIELVVVVARRLALLQGDLNATERLLQLIEELGMRATPTRLL